MNPLLVFLIAIGGVGAFAWLWYAAPRDLQPGAPDALARQGHQGSCVRWLETAPIAAAEAPPQSWDGPQTPAARVVDAVILRREGGAAFDAQEAVGRLIQEEPDSIAAALAEGRMGRAARRAARRRFHGAAAWFPLWYVLIYRIRRGPRGIHLDILCQALEEQR